eukprot:5520-Heterococcus_DN1.PRE.6
MKRQCPGPKVEHILQHTSIKQWTGAVGCTALLCFSADHHCKLIAARAALLLCCSNLHFCKLALLFFCLLSHKTESMVSTRRQKQALAAASNPLRDAGVLKHIFTFLPGHWLFLGAVCEEWRALYSSIGAQQVYSIRLYESSRRMTCESRSTSYSAAVASAETVRLACECGLAVHDRLQKAAGLYADIYTLTILRERGMPLNRSVVYAAAVSGRLSILQHLLTEEQCPVPNALSYYAARSGNMSMLNWLRAEGRCALDENTCAGAAEGGHLLLLKHLRSEGCEWDQDEIAQWAATSGSIEMVDWLRQQQGIVIDAEVL